MTREEAIQIIKTRFYPSHVGLITNETHENAKALRMAIEALSAEAISEDTQIKTKLAHIEARLENVEKGLQGLANDVLIGRSRTG